MKKQTKECVHWAVVRGPSTLNLLSIPTVVLSPSTSCLTIVTLSLYHMHPNPGNAVDSPSPCHHFIAPRHTSLSVSIIHTSLSSSSLISSQTYSYILLTPLFLYFMVPLLFTNSNISVHLFIYPLSLAEIPIFFF